MTKRNNFRYFGMLVKHHKPRKIFSFKQNDYRLGCLVPAFLLAIIPVFKSCSLFEVHETVTINYDPVETPYIDMGLVYKYLEEDYYDKIVISVIPNEGSKDFRPEKFHAITNNIMDVFLAGRGYEHVESHGEIIVNKIITDKKDSIGINYEDAFLLEGHSIKIIERGK